MRIALAGGGTGGHLFPGLALAEQAREAGDEIVFFGSTGGIEARLVPQAGFELVAAPLSGLRGASPAAKARAALGMARAAWRARRELVRRSIDVVVGLGGYASVPAAVAALASRRPLVLLEQNVEPGWATKTLARAAAVVCTSFEETARYLPGARVVCTGNPVRRAVVEARAQERRVLLVLGGSRGAQSLNRAVVAALGELAAAGDLPPVIHQAGERWREEVAGAYRACGLTGVEVHGFIADVAQALARARLVVCRAGATTLAELMATGTAAVLVPYPHAAAHQRANAERVAAAGGAIVVADDERLPQVLAATLGELLRNPKQIDSMSARMRELGRPNAALRVYELVRGVAAGSR